MKIDGINNNVVRTLLEYLDHSVTNQGQPIDTYKFLSSSKNHLFFRGFSDF